MKIAILGSAHPLRGGLAAFNERLAYQLQQQGHEVVIYSFSLQYPSFLFPGKTQFTDEQAPAGLNIRTVVNSVNPLNWLSVGRRMNRERYGLVIVKYWLPFMGPAFGTIIRQAKKNGHTRAVCIVDNIIPHEKRPGDMPFTRYFVKAIDAFVTMSMDVLKDVKTFTAKPAFFTPHPIYDSYGGAVSKEEACKKLRLDPAKTYLLFFGFIRAYKGLDLLLEAMADERIRAAGLELIAAGEYYDKTAEANNNAIIAKHGLQLAVHLTTDFIPNSDVRYYFSAASLVVQPYKHATQSGITQIAFHFEKPMVVTNVGGLAEVVPDGKAGFVAEPNAASIADSILKFFKPGAIPDLHSNLLKEKKKYTWDTFVSVMMKAAGLAGMLVFMLLWLCQPAVAQDTDTLSEIKVKGRHNAARDARVNEFAPGQKIKNIDSATLRQYQLQSMAALLAQQAPVFVKSYGFNGLATLSFRGASAAQSAVLWNGVPLQNAALGMADVSVLPVSFVSNANIVYGGSSALWGSGNVGGALLLESDAPVFDTGKKKASVTMGTGSFGQYMGGLDGSLSGKRWYFSARLFGQEAKNNFGYTTGSGAKAQMPNSALQSGAALVQGAYKIDNADVISLSAWYQQYNREIPPALFEAYSAKKETDASLRLLLDWNRKTINNNWYAKLSFIKDDVAYTDDAVQLHTANTTCQSYAEAGWKKQLFNYGQLLLFVPVQLCWISEAGGTKAQNRAALAAAYKVSPLAGLDIAINARDEIIDNQNIFLPGGDAAYALTKWLALRANVQSTYRAPTLNELYYNPGGNTSLLPEQGWNEDAGYTVKTAIGKVSVYHDVSAFNRDIHNWILWLGGAVWTPHNIAEVHSRGVETENSLHVAAGKCIIHLGLNTAYILSTTVSSYLPGDGSAGKQIPYTPRYSGQANIGITCQAVTLNYNHTYTGYRFITFDESEYLPPYQTGNLQLLFNTTLHHHPLQLTAQCNNIWNQQYQVVAYRPMPGVNWLAGVKVSWG